MLAQAALLAGLAIGASAQSSVQLFVGPSGKSGDYAVSVINVDGCTTTFGVACTAGYIDTRSSSIPCQADLTGRITIAPSSYGASTQTTISGIAATVINTCIFDGTTAATCSETIHATADGQSKSTSLTATYTGSQVVYEQVAVTAGASKLKSSCAAAGSTSSGNAAAPTGVVDVFKVMVVPAAALIAGAVL